MTPKWEGLFETSWEKETRLVRSNFSFSLDVCNPVKDKIHHYTFGKQMFLGVYWNLPFCPSMCLSVYKIVVSVKAKVLTHYQTINFRLFQTERVCRRQFQIWRKWQKVIQTHRKHCGNRRNSSLRAISHFPVFSKGLFPRGVKRCHCVGMGYVTCSDSSTFNYFYFNYFLFWHLQILSIWTKLKFCHLV